MAPSSVGKGAKNYTIFAAGRKDMSCEVRLANRCFRMRKLHEDQVWSEGVVGEPVPVRCLGSVQDLCLLAV